jgi:ABC-type sugar transport system ATPase subunit
MGDLPAGVTGVPLVEMRNASKNYSGVPAISNIDFDVRAGEVHALVGENGAGKSTLCKALSGALELSDGEILIGGKRYNFTQPADALAAGVVMVYQEASLVPTMTVAQNIKLGNEKIFNRLRELNISAQHILRSMNFTVDAAVNVSSLGAAQKQMVEIARAVYLNARIIIFDEPTATLTPEEKMHFFILLKKLRNKGVAVIFITHALDEALETSDRITVMRDGRRVLTDASRNLTRSILVLNMVGRDLSDSYYARARHQSSLNIVSEQEPILKVENVTMGKIVKNISFSIREGQITGIAGLVGSGRTEIAKIVCGVLKRNFLYGGRIYLNGKPVRYRVPKQAVDAGLVYVTEDRKLNGFFETLSISENIYLGWLATKNGFRFLISDHERESMAKEWIKRLSVRTLSGNNRVNKLSGGNQQKIVIAKSLVQKPKIVFFDEPTRGVDVGSIEEIHNYIRSLANEGIAVVFISSYLPEVLSLADRILVARQGRIVEEFAVGEATEEKIMHAAIH